jgi:hypothetical protein
MPISPDRGLERTRISVEEPNWTAIMQAAGLDPVCPITTAYPGGPSHVDLNARPLQPETNLVHQQLDLLDTEMKDQEERIDPQKKPKDQEAEHQQ